MVKRLNMILERAGNGQFRNRLKSQILGNTKTNKGWTRDLDIGCGNFLEVRNWKYDDKILKYV